MLGPLETMSMSRVWIDDQFRIGQPLAHHVTVHCWQHEIFLPVRNQNWNLDLIKNVVGT